MNVIDFLTQDHEHLRRQMTLIHSSMDQQDLRRRVMEFVASYEMHESIEEDIVFPAFDSALEAQGGRAAGTERGGGSADEPPDHEAMHAAMWKSLEKIISCLNTPHHSGLKQAFYDFSAQAEGHFRSEERFLFPAVRAVLGAKELEDLGARAQAKLERFSGSPAGREVKRHEHS